MASLGELTIAVDANTKSAESNMKKLGGSMVKFGKVALGASAAVIAVGVAAFKMAEKTAATTDRIDKLSQRLGLSREGFQEWEFVLSQSGSSMESLQSGMKVMVQKIGDLEKGTGAGAEAFKQLGISFEDIQGMAQEDVFNLTVKRFNEMEDGIAKADLAQQLFSRSGQELLPLLNSNAEAINDMKQQANDLGLVLGDDVVDAGVKLTDAMDQSKRALGAIGTLIGAKTMPAFQTLNEFIIKSMPTIQKVIDTVFTSINIAASRVVGFFNKILCLYSRSSRKIWNLECQL